jgi:hypothetical protein
VLLLECITTVNLLQVFHEKLKIFKENLMNGSYFNNKMVDGKFVNDNDDKTVAYILYVVEYQHRGLPHAHIVCQLRHGPEKFSDDHDEATVRQNLEDQIKYIDGYTEVVDGKTIIHLPNITAYRPGKVENPTTPDEIAQNILDDIIGEQMLHHCADAVNGCLDKNGNCKRQYGTFVENDATSFNEYGYPIYKRPNNKDLRVVPHNMFMLLDWCGHVCVEYATSVKSCLYLYGYLFKGTKKDKGIGTQIEDDIGDDRINENEIYLNGRFLCAMDAMGRVLGYCNYPKQTPSTICVAVKQRCDVTFFKYKRKLCNMYVYMESRNILDLQHLKFAEFFKKYYYALKRPNPSHVLNVDYYEIPFHNKICYIKKFVNENRRLVRIETIFPDRGEPYYLRLILKHRAINGGPQLPDNSGSWYDSYCHPPYGEEGSHKYSSYQAAAKAAGYLNGELFDEGLECFTEAAVSGILTPLRLREIFAMLTLDGFHTCNIIDDEDLRKTMLNDFLQTRADLPYQAYKKFQSHIRKLLKLENKELSDYGLDINVYTGLRFTEAQDTELQEYKNKNPVNIHLNKYNALKQEAKLTDDQQYIFDDITDCVMSKQDLVYPDLQPTYACIHAAGGTGKFNFHNQ